MQLYRAEKLQKIRIYKIKILSPWSKRKCPRTGMLQDRILNYVVFDSKGLFDPLKGHNNIQWLKIFFYFFLNCNFLQVKKIRVY